MEASGRSWLSILKTLILKHQIDPHEKFGENDITLLELVPAAFRSEVEQCFKEAVSKPKAKVVQHSNVAEQLIDSSEVHIVMPNT